MDISNNKLTDTITFEEAMDELKAIVMQLESDKLSLDQAIDLYKRGMTLSVFCNNKLEAAEATVKVLTSSQQGVLEEIPFDIQDEENF